MSWRDSRSISKTVGCEERFAFLPTRLRDGSYVFYERYGRCYDILSDSYTKYVFKKDFAYNVSAEEMTLLVLTNEVSCL